MEHSIQHITVCHYAPILATTIIQFLFFLQVSREKNRFEKLMEYFINDDSNIDFMVGPQMYYLQNKGTFYMVDVLEI